MDVDFAYLRRIIPVAANVEMLNRLFEDWIKEDNRCFFRTYSPQIVYNACYFLYKNIAEAIIEQLGKDLVIVHDVDYMDSVIDAYFSGFPDIEDALVRKQLSIYISIGTQTLFSNEDSWGGYGIFPNYLHQELKKNKILGDGETCIFLFGHTYNSKYAKKANYCNITYFLTNVFNPEVLNLLVDYKSWVRTGMLRNNNLRYCIDRYYDPSDYSEKWRKEKWNAIISSKEELDKFVQSYIEKRIFSENCCDLLLEYDDTVQYFLGEDVFSDCDEEQEDESEYDVDEYGDDYEDWADTNEYDEEYD